MKQAYLITKTDGSSVILFDHKRAHGLAGHYGWTVKKLSLKESQAMLKKVAAP